MFSYLKLAGLALIGILVGLWKWETFRRKRAEREANTWQASAELSDELGQIRQEEREKEKDLERRTDEEIIDAFRSGSYLDMPRRRD